MLLLLGYIFNKKSWGKKLLLAGIVLLLFFSNSYLSNLLIYKWEPPTATHTVQLYKMGKIKKILISGGLGFNPVHPLSEAESLRDFMVWAGVDKSDIIVETKASNTRENAVFSEKIITSKEVGLIQSNQLLLITSAFHMKRATACFAKVGLHPDTFPVDFYGKIPRANLRSIIQPSIDSILIWHKLTKEWIGIAVYSLVGYI